MPLQRLIGKIYPVFVEIALWIIPVTSFVGGGIFFGMKGGETFDSGFALLGLVAGLLVDVFLLGPVVVMLNMRASLKNIEGDAQGPVYYTAMTRTLVKALQDPESETLEILSTGDTVHMQKRGSNPKWFYGSNEYTGIKGWCFMAHFKKE
jgi:hypothetical protein